jgi:hypothetical protein
MQHGRTSTKQISLELFMDDYIINFDLVYVDTETRMTFKIVPEFFQVLTN